MAKKKSPIKDNRELEVLTVKELIEDFIFRIDLDADYQREKIWSVKQQEELLDSIVKDIDIPKIYLAEVEKDNKQFDFECVDGKQRMTTLLNFYKPDKAEEALSLRLLEKKYTYAQLKEKHPTILKSIDNFKLNFVIYKNIDDEFVREIFRRLQLGVRLNSGELLNSRTGAIHDFVFKEIGISGMFFRHTNLSLKRYSRQFTLSQICVNSFYKAEHGDFTRTRLSDIEDFFQEYHDIKKLDENLVRIREVLKVMDKDFKDDASKISSRAVAVSAYLFIEELYVNENLSQISIFIKMLSKLLDEIASNSEMLANYEKPSNPLILEEFHKYILQASVEGYSIRRRHDFLKKALEYYMSSKTKGQIIGTKKK